MTSCGSCKVCTCRVCAERDAEQYVAGDWVHEPWSTWLPAMIKANYWRYYEPGDLNSAVLQTGWSDDAKLEFHSRYSKRYFCTSCPEKGPLLPHQVLADHELHKTVGVSRLWNFTGVLVDELKDFLDVSDIKQKRGSDGRSYVQLRSLVRTDRRSKSPDHENTCFDCIIITTMNRRNLLTTFCSVECQFLSRLSRDAAFLFALMVPEETSVRKFHHYVDYNLARLSIDVPVQKRSKITRIVIDDSDQNKPGGRSPSAGPNSGQHAGVEFLIDA